MSFDNSYYPNRKDNRRKYYKKAPNCCRACRPHGGCLYCEENRQYNSKKSELTAREKMVEYSHG